MGIRIAIITISIISVSFTASQAQPVVKWCCSTDFERWQDRGTLQAVDTGATGAFTIEIDTSVRYQVIDGFGACFNELGWEALSILDSSASEAIIRDLFDTTEGCKFNICRMPIGASDYATSWYSLNEAENDYYMDNFSIDRDRDTLIQYIKRAMKYRPDLQVWGSPWSPPAWMKTNNNYSGGDNRLRWNSQVLDAYTLYFMKYIEKYRNEGINVYAIHVQNEPYADQTFPSCLWTAEQMRDFIRDYLGPAFEQNSVDAEIWLGTINNTSYDSCAGVVLSDEQAAAYITGVGYQWAGKEAIGATYYNHPDKKLMMTEIECGWGGNDWEYAEYVFELTKHYFDNGANSNMQWNMVLDETGLSTWGWEQNVMVSVDRLSKTVTYNPQFYLVKHFSHFIRPGARRIMSAGTWGDRIAFINTNGEIVLVMINTENIEREAAITFYGRMVEAIIPSRSFNTFCIVPVETKTAPGSCQYGKKTPEIPCIDIGGKGKAVVSFLPCAGMVDISLFNIAGEKIGTIASEYRAAGVYNDKINTGPLTAHGVYLIVLKSKEGLNAGKMLSIRD